MPQGLLPVFSRFLSNRLGLLNKLFALLHAFALGPIGCGLFCGGQRLPCGFWQIPFSGFKAGLSRVGAPFLTRPVHKALLL